MRNHAAVAIFLAAAASVFAGDEGATELLYEFRDGEAAVAAKVLEKRIELLGIEGATVKSAEDGKRVVVRLATRDRLEDVQMVAERGGLLELRRAVDCDAQEYRSRRVALEIAIKTALKNGEEVGNVREVPADSLSPAERKMWPNGVRWYRNPTPTNSPTDDWLLCEIDRLDVTEAALEEIRVRPPYGGDDMFGIHFAIKAEFQEKMAELTSAENTRLAIIVDGEMLCAPVVRSQLTKNGEISLKGEREARVLAAALGGGVLPSKPTLVAERRTER